MSDNQDSDMAQPEIGRAPQQSQFQPEEKQLVEKDVEAGQPKEKKAVLNNTLLKSKMDEFKQNINPAIAKYSDQIQKIVGHQKLCLWGATLAFGAGFAAVSINGATVGKLTALTDSEKALLAVCPSITGSCLRFPLGLHIGRTGGRKGCMIFLYLAILGMSINTIMSGLLVDNDDFASVDMSSGYYWGLLIGGLFAGCGVATFPMTINVMFWHEKSVIGTAQALYGGVGNIFPGVFAFLIPMIMSGWNLFGAYIIWLILLIIWTIMSLFMVYNPPFHQLVEMGVPHSDAEKIARMMGQQNVPKQGGKNLLAVEVKKLRNWPLFYDYFCSFGGFLAVTAYLPTFQKSYHGTNARQAGYYTACMSILASVTRSIVGPFSDKLGGYIIIQIGQLLIIAGSIIYGFSEPGTPHSAIQVIGLFVLAIGFGTGNCGVFKWIPRVAKAVAAAPVGGLAGGIGAFGGFIIPLAFLGPAGDAKTSEPNAPAYGFFCFAGLSIIALIVNFVLQRIVQNEPPSPIITYSADGEACTPIELSKQ